MRLYDREIISMRRQSRIETCRVVGGLVRVRDFRLVGTEGKGQNLRNGRRAGLDVEALVVKAKSDEIRKCR